MRSVFGGKMFRQLLTVLVLLIIYNKRAFAYNCIGGSRSSCRNFFTAQRCEVVNECVIKWRTSVWRKYRNDSSSECVVCRTLANHLPLSELKPLCSVLKQLNTSECESIIQKLPETLALQPSDKLENERDVDILCNTLSACETELYIEGLDFGSVSCDDCKKLVKRVQDSITDNATINASTSELDGVICAGLSDHVRDYCKETVKIHVPVLLHLIEVHLDPTDICALLRLCPKSLYAPATLNKLLNPNNKLPTMESMSGKATYPWINRPAGRSAHMFTFNRLLSSTSDPCPLECQKCVAVLDELKETMKNPNWQAEIKKGLENEFCSPSGFMSEVCKIAIDSQFNEFVDEIEKVNSYNACSVFQMCGSNATQLNVILQTALQPSYKIPGVCQLCKTMMKKLIDVFIEETTEASIKATLEQICNFLPPIYQNRCEEFVLKYTPQIVQAIIHGTAPRLACNYFGLCSEQMMQPVLMQSIPSTAPNKSSYCNTCKSAVDFVRKQILQQKTEEDLKEIAKRICSILPDTCASQCENLIDEYLGKVIQYLKENLTSDAVCEKIRFCSDVIPQTASQPSYELPGVCQLCETMMKQLIDSLFEKPTEQSIKATLKEICNNVPPFFRKRCDEFVEKYTPQIVKAIMDGTAPRLACNYFGLCSEQMMQPVLMQSSQSTAPNKSSYCNICKSAVDFVRKQILQPKTEEDLKEIAKRICSILPDTYVSQCENLIDENLSKVIQYLKENLTSDAVCEKIGFCPDEAGALQALCLRGPAYWCLNRETAERCNATAICTQRRFHPADSHQLCSTHNRAQICASHELAAACGLTRECLEQRMMTYLQSVSHLLTLQPEIYSTNTHNVQQGSPLNCTICTDALGEWTTSRKVLGTPFFAVQACTKYANPVDRKQCDRVWKHRYPAFRQLLRSNAKPETVCKQLNLCQAPAIPMPVSPCLDNPFYAVSSRRAAEECGTLDLWAQLQQFETKPKPTQTTPIPSRVISVPDTPACRGGPDQFCKTYEAAQLCGEAAVRDCQDNVWFGSRPRSFNRKTPLLGVVRCTRGPSYWCSSREAARSCGQEAVDYCIRQRAFA